MDIRQKLDGERKREKGQGIDKKGWGGSLVGSSCLLLFSVDGFVWFC